MKPASWATDLANLLLPAGCVACGAWIPAGTRAQLVCGRCRSRLKPGPWPRCGRCHFPQGTGRPEADGCRACKAWPDALSAARYAHVLRVPADDLVHALKYEGWPELAPYMATHMARIDLRPGVGTAVVVPVPTTADRMRSRGYNQAEALARPYAALKGLLVRDVLARSGSDSSQTTLHPAERRANVAGAFSLGADGRRAVRGAHIVLVDDVLTTGATACEAAQTLADGGAAGVTLVTYARALPDSLQFAA